jgi:hypothetical protein
MARKHCLHERPDGKIDYYQRYSNPFLKENRHFDAYVYQGWFLNLEKAESNINCLLQDDRCDFIHFEQDTIKGLTCKSWIIFSKENPSEPSDFMDKPNKHIVLKLSGGITKHLCDGHSPYYMIQESDLSTSDWTTFKSEGIKNQYKENNCPVCGELHLMQGDGEILYGHCNK